jgi:hypothetical protein
MPDITPDELRDYASRVCVLETEDGQRHLVVEIIGGALRGDALQRAEDYKAALLSAAHLIDVRNEQLAGMHRMHEQHPAIVEWGASR